MAGGGAGAGLDTLAPPPPTQTQGHHLAILISGQVQVHLILITQLLIHNTTTSFSLLKGPTCWMLHQNIFVQPSALCLAAVLYGESDSFIGVVIVRRTSHSHPQFLMGDFCEAQGKDIHHPPSTIHK